MPNGYYLKKGFVSRSELLTNGVNVKDLPVQADQTGGRLWVRPGNESDLIKPAALIDSLGGRRYPYGGAVFKWPMVGLSPKMVNYLHSTYFDMNWFAELTVQTFNRANGDWETYWVTARWPDYSSEAELSAGGYNNFQLSFVNGVIATNGPDLNVDGSTGGSFSPDSYGSFTIDISNIGDDTTFSEIFVYYALPTQLLYSHITSSEPYWGVYWSETGLDGSYQSIDSNPPASISQIHYLQLKYTMTLAASATTSVTIYVDPDVGAQDIHNVFVVTTGGDGLTGNKALDFVLNV